MLFSTLYNMSEMVQDSHFFSAMFTSYKQDDIKSTGGLLHVLSFAVTNDIIKMTGTPDVMIEGVLFFISTL